jgi:protein TonB
VAHAQNLFNISASDRLGLTLFFAIALHAIIILGVGFDADRMLPKELPPTLEITLVHSKSEKPPEKADYLAQANQSGGGNVQEQLRPSSPFPNPRPVLETEGNAQQTLPMQLPQPSTASDQQPVMLAENESSLQWQTQQDESRAEVPETPNPTELMLHSLEMARTMASLEQKQQAYAKMTREKYISANTTESVYAAYMDAWTRKIERHGTMHYPAKNLTGSVILDVAINADGTIHSIEIDKPSRHRELNNAAIQTVRALAPFARFPDEILKETSVVHIVRTWNWTIDGRYSLRSP